MLRSSRFHVEAAMASPAIAHLPISPIYTPKPQCQSPHNSNPNSTLTPQLPFILQKLEWCRNMEELKQIHVPVIKLSHLQSTLVLSKILSFSSISPFGNIDYALAFFCQITNPTTHFYNSIIRGLSQSKKPEKAILIFKDMVQRGAIPDNYTYPFIIRACARLGALQEGEEIHAQASKVGLLCDVYVVNNLMRMYADCACIEATRQLFDETQELDLVSWTTLITAYANLDFHRDAIDAFLNMTLAKIKADEVTMTVVLSSCAQLGDLELGERVHKYIEKNGVKLDVFVGNALVDMYLKCGDMNMALKIFDGMPKRNVVTWNALIAGLAQQGFSKEALSAFRQLLCTNEATPDSHTIVGVLCACASLGALDLGKWIHAYIGKNNIETNGFVGNALIDMYAKCGSIDSAFLVFSDMRVKDVYSWTAIIVGFAIHGKGPETLEIFIEMIRQGMEPDSVTLIGVLSGCSHAGLVEEGRHHFKAMPNLYKLTPQIEHYGCMVDLFGRASLFEDAMKIIDDMPMEPDASVWGALLGACRIHGKVDLGERIAKKLIDLEPTHDGTYVLISNLYASNKRWKDAINVRKTMKGLKIKKQPGCSLIELDGVVYEFRMGEESHPQTKDIYSMLEEITERLKHAGYTANTSQVLLDVDEEEKEYALCRHSEKLAIAFGLINTSHGTTLRIVKNLRVCSDCHSMTKFVSEIFHREIVVRDRNRFHHFKGGLCSCGDYW
ncbi:hypothetical protein AMTRI_Chr03g145030 [Amborella trichopoda]